MPTDLSVIGYDDSALMSCTDPPLTTVRQPLEAIGRAAVEMLADQIEGSSVSPDELFFEPEVVARGSTANARPALRSDVAPPCATRLPARCVPRTVSTKNANFSLALALDCRLWHAGTA